MGEAAPRLVLDQISRRFGALDAVQSVSLAIMPGEVVCLLGPSGCGKSTSLRIAAGVEHQTSGRVLIDGREVASDAVFVPPEARGIGLMFQDYALFPHMTVGQNVAFGLGKWPRDKRRGQVQDMLSRVEMEGFIDAHPGTLSGGEQQRVALARALAPEPGVMLMDEPFSGLDVPRRNVIRDKTWEILKATKTATLLVTHEPKEAMRMADRIALMRNGKIVQVGPPDEIYNRPVDAAAARFFSDINVFEGRAQGGRVETPLGIVGAGDAPDGARVDVMARPHAVKINGAEDPGAVRAVVQRAVLLGPESLIEARLEGDPSAEPVRILMPGTVLPEAGALVGLSIRGEDLFVFPQSSEG